MPPLRLLALFVLFATISAPLSVGEAIFQAVAPAPHEQSSRTASLEGDPNHPAETRGWVETELYFGLGPADAPSVGVSEGQWRRFLDKEVTPRFPCGLTVINVYGQWQNKAREGAPLRTPTRMRSRLLIVCYPRTPANLASIEAIRIAWKQRTGDQSVLKVTRPADVSF